MTENGNYYDELRALLSSMLDETSNDFSPWEAATLMEQTNRDVWWQQQKLLRAEGLPSRTDFPDALAYRDGVNPSDFVSQSFIYIESNGVLAYESPPAESIEEKWKYGDGIGASSAAMQDGWQPPYQEKSAYELKAEELPPPTPFEFGR